MLDGTVKGEPTPTFDLVHGSPTLTVASQCPATRHEAAQQLAAEGVNVVPATRAAVAQTTNPGGYGNMGGELPDGWTGPLG